MLYLYIARSKSINAASDLGEASAFSASARATYAFHVPPPFCGAFCGGEHFTFDGCCGADDASDVAQDYELLGGSTTS